MRILHLLNKDCKSTTNREDICDDELPFTMYAIRNDENITQVSLCNVLPIETILRDSKRA